MAVWDDVFGDTHCRKDSYRYQPIWTDVANSAPWRLHSRRCSSEVDCAPRVPNASLRSSSSPTSASSSSVAWK